MKVFITGANGFIGRNLCEHLAGKYELFTPSSKELDLLDEAAVRKYVQANDVDIIIHSANRGGSRDTADMKNVTEYNLRMFFNIARNSGEVDRVLYFGSGAEFGKHRNLHKVKEEQFDEVVPKDDYGFYKYVCNKHAEKSENIINLRLFGAFGKYENYKIRFISNAILKNLIGEEIVISQNVVFDYLFVADLVKITEYFLKSSCGHNSYNITPTESIDLVQVCKIINSSSDSKSKTKVLNKGLNLEYTGDNSRLLREIKGVTFTGYPEAIASLYSYYKSNLGHLDMKDVGSDKYLKYCKTAVHGEEL